MYRIFETFPIYPRSRITLEGRKADFKSYAIAIVEDEEWASRITKALNNYFLEDEDSGSTKFMFEYV